MPSIRRALSNTLTANDAADPFKICQQNLALLYTKGISQALMHRLFRFCEVLGLSYPVDLVMQLFDSVLTLCIGKTTTSEFTMINSGPETTNPHDSSRTTGSSSTGSAAAVADFQVPLSVGTQTGGSIIRPASFTGIFAMKPTYNSISTEGQETCSITIDTFGFFVRSIEDLQLVADVFGLKDNGPLRDISLKEARVAVMKTPVWHRAGPGTVAAMEKAAAILESCGAKVEQVSFPSPFDDFNTLERMHSVITNSDVQAAFLKDYRMDKSKLDPEIRSIVESSSDCTRQEVMQALDRYASMWPIFDGNAADFSVIITPSAIDVAPLGLDDMGSAAFNWFWTVSTSLMIGYTFSR